MGAYDTVPLQITYKNVPRPSGKENFQIWGPIWGPREVIRKLLRAV